MKVPLHLVVGTAVHRALQRIFFKIGLALHAYPWLFLIFGLVLAGAMLPGQFVIDNKVSAVVDLWVPSHAPSLPQNEYIQNTWGSPTRFNTVIFEEEDGKNVITRSHLSTIFSLYDAITTATAEFEGNTIRFEDVCLKLTFGPVSTCFQSGILAYWDFNETKMLEDPNLLATISNRDARDQYGRVINPDAILGQNKPPSIDPVTGNYTSVPAVTLSFLLDEKTQSQEWELAFIEALDSTASPGMRVHPNAARSLGDALSGSIQGDLGLIFGAIGLIVVYTMVFLGDFDYHFLRTRLALAAVGVLTALLSVYAAFGLCAWIGVIYGSPNQVLTFLILGIGVDDMFIIANEVGATPSTWSTRKRLAVGLSHAGASITLTSLTNIFAFAIGALSTLPAIQSFCIHASIAILLDYVFQILIFTSLLVYDLERERVRRIDCFCCIRLKKEKKVKDELSEVKVKKPRQFSCGQRLLGDHYAPFLMKLPVKIAVLVIFLGFLGFSIYMGVRIQREFRQEDLIPAKSPAYNYIEARDRYFSGTPTTLYLYVKNVDYHLSSVQTELLDVHAAMLADVDRLELPVDPWLVSFNTYAALACNSTATKSEFYSCFSQWFKFGPGAQYQSNIVIADDGTIASSRFAYSAKGLDSADRQLLVMDQTRSASRSALGGNVFPFSVQYLFWEVFGVIISEAVQNVVSVLVVVFIVSLLFLIHPWIAVLCTIVVAIILADLLGLMVMWDLNLDSVTVANLVMATGFAVDYSAHICHSFMVHVGTKDERIIGAIRDMGASVISGGASTFLGIVLLAASSSGIFVAFFKMLFGTVLFGLVHGLVFLPVVLSFVGPSSLPLGVLDAVGTHEGEDEDEDEKEPHSARSKVLEEVTTDRDTSTSPTASFSPDAHSSVGRKTGSDQGQSITSHTSSASSSSSVASSTSGAASESSATSDSE